MKSSQFLLDPSITYLNHGSYGATPTAVLEAQHEWRTKMEGQPMHFMHRILPVAYRHALERAAAFINADSTGLAFVPNATTGCNAIFQNIRLEPGDEILTTNHRYDAVFNTMTKHALGQQSRVVIAKTPFAATPEAIAESLYAAITPKTKLLILDHISSATARLFPIEELTRNVQQQGIMVFIDAAHSPGQVHVDIDRLKPDFWTGNLHKWCCAPKGAALLYVAKKHREHFHAPIISHGYKKGFHEEMSWMGTADYSAYLAAVTAMDLHEHWGGEVFRSENASMQEEATSQILHHLPHLETAPNRQPLAMRSFVTPYTDAEGCYNYLLKQHGIELFINPWQGKTIFRISCFSKYNRIEDYQRLIHALKAWELRQKGNP